MTNQEQENPQSNKSKAHKELLDLDRNGDPKDEKNSPTPSQTCKYEPQQPPNIIIQQEKFDNTTALEANRISHKMFLASVAASIISLGVLLATYFIWKETKHSVSVAQDALMDNRKKDSLQRIADSANSVKQDSTVRKRFNLDSASVAKQIKVMQATLRETKRQFQELNKPYLQVGKITYMYAGVESPLTTQYTLYNVGTIPVKIMDSWSYDVIDHPGRYRNANPPTIEYMRKNASTAVHLNLYATKEIPTQIKAFDAIVLDYPPPGDVVWIYVYRKIRYENLVTKDRGIYEFFYRIRSTSSVYPNGVEYDLLYNENEDSPKMQTKPTAK